MWPLLFLSYLFPKRSTSRILSRPLMSEDPSELTPPDATAPQPPPQPCSENRQPNPNSGLLLLQLPPELFDEIIGFYSIIPDTYYFNGHDLNDLPKFFERTGVLTALSQTCRALKDITLHRLWMRLDICRITDSARLPWYEQPMTALERKANGIAESPMRHHVRTLTIVLGEYYEPDTPLAALWDMLRRLPNLRKIHVLACTCKATVLAESLVEANLQLPNVTTLFVPDHLTGVFQRICPNVTHFRCSEVPLLSALTSKTQRVDGMIDWRDPEFVDRLIKRAPNLRTLEIRRPVDFQRHINLQDTAPSEWVQVIPKLASLKQLSELILTFPSELEGVHDAESIAAARSLMETSPFAGQRRLVTRRVTAPHYTNAYHVDFVHSSDSEIF
ncbi:hypothetical protein DFH07DRAFT_806329 [Mycena maculata]|uniref:F-box domain-containing protein n=1 Tax=Mycena maculata TaxID=230809 RepID=A0AAD7JTM9_9AGAR|nr:hypothetical protein DFH07DRAFT_806329 [Mycena maculata]